MTVSATVNTEGDVVRTTGIVTDVTEALLAKQALESSERRFQDLVTNAPDAIVGADEDLHIRIWNDAATAMFGHTKDEILGKPISLLIPDDLRKGHSALAEGFVHGPIERFQMRTTPVSALHKNAGEVPVETSLAKIPGDHGQIVVATLRDVTEKIRVQPTRDLLNDGFRALAQHSDDLVVVADASQTVTYVSPAVDRVLGCSAEEVVGRDVTERMQSIHPQDQDLYRRSMAEVLAESGAHRAFNYRHKHANGKWRQFHIRMTNHLHTRGIDGVISNVRDITEESQNKINTQTHIDELRAVLDALPDQMYRITREGVVNQSLTPDSAHIVDGSRLIGRNLVDVLPGGFRYELLTTIARVCDHHSGETLICDESDLGLGGSRSFEIRISPLSNNEALGSLRDITAQIHDQRQLSYQALHDSLTGLPNRLLFSRKLQAALDRTSVTVGKVGVLFLDLDDFKAINDRLGHSAGDELLISVADNLRSAIRPNDTIARLGGDEFVIMCEELTNSSEAETTARSICSLLAQADSAMYRAKDLGRARAEAFDANVRRFPHRRVDLENDLKTAINNGELTVGLPTDSRNRHAKDRISSGDSLLDSSHQRAHRPRGLSQDRRQRWIE